jgi:hypothetical protein
MARLCNQLQLLVLVIIQLLHPALGADFQTPSAKIPAAYFGLHIHHLASAIPTPWPNMPVPEWRLWDAEVTWADLEPTKGQWNFAKLDNFVSLAQQHGTGILLPLGGSPAWASARPHMPSNYSPGFTAEPANLDDWRTYVSTIAERYKGRIEAYEIWNEPNLKDFWSGTMDQMLTLTKEASEIIHRVDSRALLVSPSATANYGTPWLAEFLKKGGGQYVDVIGYHFYVSPHTDPPEELVPFIRSVRQIISDNGLADKPLWNTETGWLNPAKFDSDEVAAGFLARAYVLGWAAGVQRFYWYAWDNQYVALRTYQEQERTVTAAGNAYKIVEQWLVGAKMTGCMESSDQVWTCLLERSGKKQWIVWNPQGEREFEVPGAWHVQSITPLLHDREFLTKAKIAIGPAPVLLTGIS